MLKVSNKNTRTTFRTSFCCLYCLLWRYLVPFSTLSIDNFEQVNVCWDRNRRVSIRSSHRRCSVTKGVLRNFAKLTRQHLCQRLFFNEVEGLLSYFLLRPACNFIKKRVPGTGVFLWILRNFWEHPYYRTPPDDCFRSIYFNKLNRLIFQFVSKNLSATTYLMM